MQPRAVFGKRSPAPSTPAPASPAEAAPPPRKATLAFCERVTETAIKRLEAETAAAQAGGAEEIVWVISSPGGELLPTLEYCRKLTLAPVNLTTIAVGQVASAATYLMLAGGLRIAHPDATFLFHAVSTVEKPPPGTFRARSVERHRALFELTGREVYRNRTRMPPDLIDRFANETVILNAQEALQHGVVHAIALPPAAETAPGEPISAPERSA